MTICTDHYVSLTQTWVIRIREPHLGKCLHKICLEESLWCVFLCDDWSGRAEITMGGTTSGLWVLGALRKQADQTRRFLPCLSSCPDFFGQRTQNPFFLKWLWPWFNHSSRNPKTRLETWKDTDNSDQADAVCPGFLLERAPLKTAGCGEPSRAGGQNEQNWAAIYLFQLDFIMVILLSMRSVRLAGFFFFFSGGQHSIVICWQSVAQAISGMHSSCAIVTLYHLI